METSRHGMSGKSRESILRKLSIEQVEWQTGICRIPDEKASGSILFTGDWVPHREFFSLMVEKPRDIYGDTLEFLQRADLRILNLECAMGGDTPLVKSGPLIRGGREHLPCFRSAQADLVSLANNHFCDYGPTGVQETIALLREEGIDFCGAGSSLQEALQFVVREVNGVKVAFLSFSESGSDLPEAGAQTYGLFAWHPEMVAEQIKLARSCSDLVVVLMHAGCEHIPYPPLYVQQTARKLAEAGADAVVGHHPHVPQGIELHQGVPIAYSLGNYIFPPHIFEFNARGYLLRLDISPHRIVGFQIFPYQIDPAQGVSLLKGREKEAFLKILQELSAPFAAGLGAEAWYGVLAERWQEGYHLRILQEDQKRFAEDPAHAAANLRNRNSKTCHVHFWKDYYHRMAERQIQDAPEWAVAMSRRFTKLHH